MNSRVQKEVTMMDRLRDLDPDGSVARAAQEIFSLMSDEGVSAADKFVDTYVERGRLKATLAIDPRQEAGDTFLTRILRTFQAAGVEEIVVVVGHDAESVVGRLRKGAIRTGDIYNLESWQDHVMVVQIKGSNLAGPLLAALRTGGAQVGPERVYTVAATGEVVSESAAEKLGKIESSRRGPLLRDATIAYLRRQGFADLRAEHG